MKRLSRLIAAILAGALAGACASSFGIREEAMKLPASFASPSGVKTFNLEALVLRPDDDQRHPLAIINHGTPAMPDLRNVSLRGSMRSQAWEFARRGWVAVAFLRRGYGTSEGEFFETVGGCDNANFVASGRAGAEDVREVIRLMKEKPYVDASRVISVGSSAGGFTTVALTAEAPPGLVAGISFAGGRGKCARIRLEDAYETFGKTSRTPMLWVYAENDSYFDPALAKRLHKVFTSGGGRAELVITGAFDQDGHNMFGLRRGIGEWSEHVDRFLAAHELNPEPTRTAAGQVR